MSAGGARSRRRARARERRQRKTQEECFREKREKENRNSMQEDTDVPNRHMTWWRRAWWIQTDIGPSMRSARGRRRVWRADKRAAELARAGDGIGETQHQAEKRPRVEEERERRQKTREERGQRKTQEECFREKREKENRNSMQEDTEVPNRHMTWWRRAWWIQIDIGPSMRSARGRRRVWRADKRAAELARAGDG